MSWVVYVEGKTGEEKEVLVRESHSKRETGGCGVADGRMAS